jgi:hypothetical protein
LSVAAFAVAVLTALVFGSIAAGNHSATDRISVGQINGNGPNNASYAGSTADGTRVFFTTDEQLVAADTDTSVDLYERSNGVTTLISTGPAGGNGAFDTGFVGMSADGSHVFFVTNESLVANDTDSNCTDQGNPSPRPCRDVYERFNGTTTLVSTGGNGSFDASFEGATPGGSKVWFSTAESLLPGDTDSSVDIYQRSGGTTTLISTSATAGNGAFDASFSGASADGSRVFFVTNEAMDPSDTDGNCFDIGSTSPRPCQDVYERSGGTTTLLSTGPTTSNAGTDATFAATSADGTKVVFTSKEALVAGDTDATSDVYTRSGGTTTLVSTGPTGGIGAFDAGFGGASADASRIYFRTNESLVAGDTDTSIDIYDNSGGTTTLDSGGQINGNGAFDVFYRGITPDGSHVYFTTAEQLAAADTDTFHDVYDHSASGTTLVSAGQINGNGPYMVTFRGASDDGSRVFFSTRERLVSADSDPVGSTCVSSTCSVDIYERYAGTTYLTSLGPTLDNGNKNAVWGGTSADGLRVFYSTAKAQVPTDTDTAQDVYQASVPQVGYPRPKGATPMRASLVPAFAACTSPNNTHGPPLAFSSCGPPTQTSGQLTVGSPDANGAPANSVSFIKMTAIPGNASTPANEADVALQSTITDVRSASTLADYTGEVQPVVTLQITDRLSGAAPQDPATVQPLPFKWTVPCTATAATNVGATCTSNTTANAILPGAVIESARSVWELGKIQVFDGGSDGLAGTAPNTLFEVQGVYVP